MRNAYRRFPTFLMAIISLQCSTIYLLRNYHFTKLSPLSERVSFQKDRQGSVMMRKFKRFTDEMNIAPILDSNGTYISLPNLVKGKLDARNSDGTSLTICTQTTVNNLYYLADLVKVWNGPISVTVFAHGENVTSAVYAVGFYSMCYENIARQVSFHIVYPVDSVPHRWHNFMTFENYDCESDIFIKNTSGINYGDTEVPYPINVLRNIAISYSETPYILVTDIDIIPSIDLQANFHRFILRTGKVLGKEKVVFVTPVFELSKLDKIFFNKSVLLNDWTAEAVRPFYGSVCPPCQIATDYQKWRDLPQMGLLDVGYVLERENNWEPFYIAKKEGLPLYDGRFKQYGSNRMSQVR